MNFTLNEFYHIYNRGNNQQTIFFNPGNYLFFIKKIRTHLFPASDIIAYCLMPNHFPISYLETCFFYIHNNPVQAELVNESSKWLYSSYCDYAGLRKGTLCNQSIFFNYTGLLPKDIVNNNNEKMTSALLEKIF